MPAESHALSDGSGLEKVDPTRAPIQTALGVLGMPGMTAYRGLLEVGKPAARETVVVAAASGAVGSVVGQIARIKGAYAVGIAGGPEKCRYVTNELWADWLTWSLIAPACCVRHEGRPTDCPTDSSRAITATSHAIRRMHTKLRCSGPRSAQT
jgi:hypothetical protein